MSRTTLAIEKIRRFLFGGDSFFSKRQIHKKALKYFPKIAGSLLESGPDYQIIRLKSDFDRAYGVNTSGYTPWEKMQNGNWSDPYSNIYEPSSPTVIRQIFAHLPDLSDFSFVDFGCGMGRALIIASEFPLKAIIGIEKQRDLCAIAHINAQIIKTSHSDRTVIEVRRGDVTDAVLPTGDLVLFFFDPFMKPVLKTVLTRIEAAMKAESRRVFVVYILPRHRDLFDACPALIPDPDRSFILLPDDGRERHVKVAIWHNGYATAPGTPGDTVSSSRIV